MTLDELQKMKELQALNDERSTIARAGVGLSNALVGLGASPDVAHQAYQAGGNYLQQTQPAPIKDLKEVSVQGHPVYMTPQMANMQEAFNPARGNSLASKLMKNLDTGEVLQARQTPTGLVDLDGNPISNRWVEFKTSPLLREKLPSGGSVAKSVNPYNQSTSVISSQQGIGDVIANQDKTPKTKEEAQSIIKGAEKGRDLANKHQEDINNASSALAELQNTKDPMVFSTALGKLQRTTVGENRLSDDEAVRYMGGDYKSMLTRGSEYFTGKFQGEIPDSVRANAINMARYAIQKAQAGKDSVLKAYAGTQNLGKKGAGIIQGISGQQNNNPESAVESTDDWKNRFR